MSKPALKSVAGEFETVAKQKSFTSLNSGSLPEIKKDINKA